MIEEPVLLLTWSCPKILFTCWDVLGRERFSSQKLHVAFSSHTAPLWVRRKGGSFEKFFFIPICLGGVFFYNNCNILVIKCKSTS